MVDCVALLVSTDPLLIATAAEGIEPIEGLRLEVCAGLEEADRRLGRDQLVLVLIHLTRHSDDAEVTRFATAVGGRDRPCAAVLLSDDYRDHQAVALLRAGAADYLGLPVTPLRLASLADTLTLRGRFGLRRGPAPTGGTHTLAQPDQPPFVLAAEMVDLMEQVRRVGPRDSTLLLTGETGTGKTRLARLIHELSPRRDEPFLVVDCGALSASLIESEMFGHVKGAFTGADRDRAGKFAAAGGGTLLLDEINSLSAALQGKLLRVLDERVFEPVGSDSTQPLRGRLIVASNTSLDREVTDGRFRADLYYRLNVVGLYLAPLRERRGLIGPLANRFLVEFSGRSGRTLYRIAPEALQALEGYTWPGNVRELRNVIERAVALCPGAEVKLEDLPRAVRSGGAACPAPRPAPRPSLLFSPAGVSTLRKTREEVELVRIAEALERHSNNRRRAAAELGISRMSLYKKLHKYGLMGAG